MWVLWHHSWIGLIFFVVFGTAGIAGEVLISFWWKAFYNEPLWTYAVETEVHRYTSRLNFVFWGAGGLFYLDLLQLTGVPLNKFYHPFLWTFYSCFFLMLFGLLAVQKYFFKKASKVTFSNYLFFCSPFLLALGLGCWWYGNEFLLIAMVFGLVVCFLEYLLGKLMQAVISKKFWTYTYLSMDDGHFTPLSIALFSLAGFYFWAVAAVVYSFI